MTPVKFYMSGVLCDPPVNWKEIQIEAVFNNNEPSSQISTRNFKFIGDDAFKLNAWLKGGTNGTGPGITEGVPFRIEFCGPSGGFFEGVLNLMDENVTFACEFVECPMVQGDKVDFIKDKCDAFGFAYLASLTPAEPGYISTADYIPVPYCITEIPNYTQAALMAISIYVLTKDSLEVVRDIADLVAEAASLVITAVAIVKIAFYLIYLTALIIAMIQLLNTLMNNIIQPAKYKYCMRVLTMFEKGFAHMGYNFSSTILQTAPMNDFCLMPKKVIDPGVRDKDDLGNSNAYGYYDQFASFSDYIISMEKLFSAELRIVGNTAHFELPTFFQNQSGYVMDDIFQWPYGTNAFEAMANYLFSWSYDTADYNTLNEIQGLNAQVIIKQISVNVQKNVILKGLKQTVQDFAQARRKTQLTEIEIILNDVLNVVFGIANAVTGAINAIVSLVGGNFSIPQLPMNIFNNRIGWMKLSSDFTSVAKAFFIDAATNKLHPLNDFYSSAIYFVNTFHYWQFVTRGNQWYMYRNKKLLMCCSDFLTLLGNNYFRDTQGNLCRADSIKWHIYEQIADIMYRKKKTWSSNLQETVLINRN